MIRYWRLQDIPELRGMPRRRQRTLWSEAVSRSTTPRRLLILLAARALAAAAILVALRTHFSWPVSLALALVLALFAQLGIDSCVTAPAARNWLREHAHELDRYAPE